MSLIFPPMNNQPMVPITTVNSNALVILTCSSTITATAISSSSDVLSINPAPAIYFQLQASILILNLD